MLGELYRLSSTLEGESTDLRASETPSLYRPYNQLLDYQQEHPWQVGSVVRTVQAGQI